MSLVRVWTDVGHKKPKALLAKIFKKKGGSYTIRYLSAVPENAKVFKYEDDEYVVDDESISEWLETDLETDVGFDAQEDGTYSKIDSDSDYEPEDSGPESGSDDSDPESDEELDEAEEFESEEENIDEY
jgi:hypothetical protein